jgi:hypothetical protein
MDRVLPGQFPDCVPQKCIPLVRTVVREREKIRVSRVGLQRPMLYIVRTNIPLLTSNSNYIKSKTVRYKIKMQSSYDNEFSDKFRKKNKVFKNRENFIMVFLYL